MKKLKLKFLGELLELELIKAKYPNDKTYYGLRDTRDGEPFSDITVNLYNDDKMYLSNDFLNICFNGDWIKCFTWLKRNINADTFYFDNESGFYYFTTK